jgi:hypothetical protein
VPAIVTRYETPSLITCLGFLIGLDVGCLDLVINAIALDR